MRAFVIEERAPYGHSLPTGRHQQRGDVPIAVAAVLRGKSDDRAGQRVLVSLGNSRVALRAARLVDNPADVAFEEPVLLPDALNSLPVPFGAYKFPDATFFRICFSSDRLATRRFRRTFSRFRSFIRRA
jgi:hypothetical protein